MIGKRKYTALVDRLVRFLNRRTIYPVIFGGRLKGSSPDTFQMVIDSGYFRSFLKPQSPDLGRVRSVLVVAPHQDDEAIGCGGLLLKLKGHARIDVLFVTDGAQDNLGVSVEDSVKVRRSEAEKVMAYLDGNADYLGLPNMNLTVEVNTIELLKGALARYNPDLILSPWLFDRPRKHRLVNVLLLEAFKQLPQYRDKPIWNYQVHNVLFPNVVVDITSEMEDKLRMIREYESQLNLIAPYDHFVGGMNQWNAQYLSENKRGFAEVFFALPVRDLIGLYDDFIHSRLKGYIENG